MAVGQNALLARRTFALSVAAIVESKDRNALSIAQLQQIRAHRPQALAVAMAIKHHGPRLWVLDEPAVHLDEARRAGSGACLVVTLPGDAAGSEVAAIERAFASLSRQGVTLRVHREQDARGRAVA